MMARRLLLQFLSILLLVCWAECCQKLEEQWLKEEMTKEWHLFPEYADEYVYLASHDKYYSDLKKEIWTYLLTLKKELMRKQSIIDFYEQEKYKRREKFLDEYDRKVEHARQTNLPSYYWTESEYAVDKGIRERQKLRREYRELERQQKLERERQRELDSINEREGLP
ncbi:uncharacterized protein LOC106073544 isoform X1 [Biomphalaria glabrata]|uniref:Uncharacterized protein LOC106073544 isoform X1 n=1 Tax=Biomphalaria glabrata TaxID=6526 RepID=A0A9W3AXE3_BIOGL|nr:uncharacterized protein LOC106073544 isoform X1 [Biomphalaria glabrata]